VSPAPARGDPEGESPQLRADPRFLAGVEDGSRISAAAASSGCAAVSARFRLVSSLGATTWSPSMRKRSSFSRHCSTSPALLRECEVIA
jgi:hypothetical protein